MISIANTSIEVLAENSDMQFRLDPAAKAFLADVPSPDITISATWGELSQTASGTKVFNAGGIWELTRLEREYCFRFFTRLRGAIPYKEARITTDFCKGRVVLHRPHFSPEQPVNPMEYPFDELLLVHYLSQRGGVVVHGCGIVDEVGQGYLFIGHSGAGKTTTALLWENKPGVRVLSDDRIVLRQQNGQITMYGTPWHGEGRLSSPASCKLSSIFFIEHGESNEIKATCGGEVITALIARSFLPFHDTQSIGSVIGFFAELGTHIPCFNFSFRPDQSAVSAVQVWAEGHGLV